MRPLRLVLDGFGSYRHPADVDFSGVDFFALTGPTGSGKSTVIDGLCFALYGTVPRWGKENVIADALAPAANSCRVCLVFETAGVRYAAVRELARNKRGQVNTRNARLERLEPSVPASAPMEKILQAVAEPMAEGPDAVTAGVQRLLGLSYEHFTQSVLLPQGRFAEFLQAKPRQRQDLLVGLLALGIYEQVGQRARERAQRAAVSRQMAERARDDLADATVQAQADAADRVAALTGLAGEVDRRLAALAELQEQARQAAEQAGGVRAESDRLAAVGVPAGVRDLAERIASAEARIEQCRKLRGDTELREAEAARIRNGLPDRARLERLRDGYEEQRALAALLDQQEAAVAARVAQEDEMAGQLAAAERELDEAADALAAANQAHAAAVLAESLEAGEACPVCFQPVTALPRHAAPPGRADAKSRAADAAKQRNRAQAAHAAAGRATAAARTKADGTRQRLADVAAFLSERMAEADARACLAAVSAADDSLDAARRQAQAARAAADAAELARAELADGERKARAALHKSRDTLAGLDPPAVDDQRDLAAAWATLTEWAAAQRAERGARQPGLDAAADARRREAAEHAAGVSVLLGEHGVAAVSDPAQAPVRVAEQRAQAEERLAAVRRARSQAAKLDKQIAGFREEEQVAAMLGNLLRANTFERWLCSEALESLVVEASATLMELSGGQYQLNRDDRNNLFVIDYNDAAAQRPVHTLSGGETFQASLALALALSHQVIALSAGMRDLNSMFLDEGFGTLDEDTLDTVASTLERLAADSDRMVGIVTHVAALAERVPVRFVVSREGPTSTLRKEQL